ncbi:unnamed protein product [Rotaria sordida]|uniref:Caspase family p20 domain-containing protein n=1 Tax=Rotaria sordida TaxID=392033 RepID=A0A813PSX9_9BILA|nr:unnamed protein product [Rotaria sordida]CAF3483147.1 unnamed protein product [Rotaria sordida]
MTSSAVYQRKRALIIGINTYPRDPLQYCINDAEDLSATLQCIGFDITLELGCHYSKFYNVIDEFAERIQHDELVLFYFAGHGKQSKDQNYLLPSDYDYDYRRHERHYITDHAINVQYIMKKIDDKLCRTAIYIFDCCRKLIRTRATNENQGLSPIHPPPKTLIVFACAPGKTVQDETQNGRNGSFMENLLKWIVTCNTDIEEIMKNVASAVNLQTAGFQLPYRASSLTDKICLVINNSQG